jgi:dihydrofolate reductase
METTTGEFGVKMNAIPKYVVSGTLERADWNNSTVIVPDRAMDEIPRLKEELAGDVLVNGSGKLVRSLMDAGLIDEYRLMVFPILLGGGKRLFAGSNGTASLKLVSAHEVADALILTYVPR